jgi:hypothetical protein
MKFEGLIEEGEGWNCKKSKILGWLGASLQSSNGLGGHLKRTIIPLFIVPRRTLKLLSFHWSSRRNNIMDCSNALFFLFSFMFYLHFLLLNWVVLGSKLMVFLGLNFIYTISRLAKSGELQPGATWQNSSIFTEPSWSHEIYRS